MEKITRVDNYLVLNTKIIVDVLSGENIGRYESRIEDIDKKYVYISMPTKDAIPVPLPPKTKIEVLFLNEKGRFSFKSEVVDRLKEKIVMLKILKPEYLIRKELRRFFRVEIHAKTNICKIYFNEDVDVPDIKKECLTGIIKDISGGGLKIVTDMELKIDDIVEIDLSSIIKNIKEVFGKVVRVIPVNDRFEVGIEFISIRETDRDKIIQYVFKRQIELRNMQK